MSIIAQAAQALDSSPILLAYGPMGLMLAWFMLRGEKLASKVVDLAHRIDGLTKALLVDMVDRDTAGPHVKQYAKETIAKIDARNSQSDKGTS
jgi:hypothetical protein